MGKRSFGVWLRTYKGSNQRVTQVRDWFVERLKTNGWKASDFETADCVWADFYNSDNPPDWVPNTLRACDRVFKDHRIDFNAKEQLQLAQAELSKP